MSADTEGGWEGEAISGTGEAVAEEGCGGEYPCGSKSWEDESFAARLDWVIVEVAVAGLPPP